MSQYLAQKLNKAQTVRMMKRTKATPAMSTMIQRDVAWRLL